VINLEPRHALAYAALGECFCSGGFLGYLPARTAFPSAKAAAATALTIDPALGEANAVLGFANAVYDWKWALAEQSLLRAVHLAPSCVQTRLWHSVVMVMVGRFQEARAEIEHAWDLDPLSPHIRANVGFVLFEARLFEEAYEHCLRTVELNPGHALANFHLGRACNALGRFQQAVHAFEMAAPSMPIALANLGALSAKLGQRRKALEILAGLKQMSASRHVGWICFATVHSGLGNVGRALDCYEKALDSREGFSALLGVEPGLEEFRSDPRFQTLIHRLGLPAQAAGLGPRLVRRAAGARLPAD
jgi:tetratricopeptide (TPR) repeat protein